MLQRGVHDALAVFGHVPVVDRAKGALVEIDGSVGVVDKPGGDDGLGDGQIGAHFSSPFGAVMVAEDFLIDRSVKKNRKIQ